MKKITKKLLQILVILMFLMGMLNINVYAEEGNQEGETPKEGTEQQTGGTEQDTEQWTDFSKAKFELKKNGNSNTVLEITGVTPNENSVYYKLFLTNNSSKPSFTENEIIEKGISLNYDKNSKAFTTIDSGILTKNVELNQDLYVSVLEENSKGNDKIISYGNKIERFEEPKYSDAFFATFMTNDRDQIVTNFTHDKTNNRKMQIKVGKITNNNILQKIKNKDTSGFSDLLSFAKSNSGLFNETLNADNDSSFFEYNGGINGNKVIDVKGLEDKQYYYLYIKTDDENGKYISNEGVTLALSSVYNSGWGLFFYGEEDFNWITTDVNTVEGNGNTGKVDPEDVTVANKNLPNTGIATIVTAGILLVVIGNVIFLYNKNKKYEDVE